MVNKVDEYLLDGCGRCKFYGTENCKVNTWRAGLKILRTMVLDFDLEENIKWGVPCYSYKNSNILIIAAFRDYFAISFFKGDLLLDPGKYLSKPGENTQEARLLKFTDNTVDPEMEPVVKDFILQAIEIEDKGIKGKSQPREEIYPDVLLSCFRSFPEFEIKFKQLTPGKRRGYILLINQAKQEKTKLERIEKIRKELM